MSYDDRSDDDNDYATEIWQDDVPTQMSSDAVLLSDRWVDSKSFSSDATWR